MKREEREEEERGREKEEATTKERYERRVGGRKTGRMRTGK